MSKTKKKASRGDHAGRTPEGSASISRHTRTLTLTVRGSLISKSTSIGAYGVDAVSYRSSDGPPALPGSLVQGRLREAWEDLADILVDAPNPVVRREDVDRWLGAGSNTSDETPRRGVLVFPHEFTTSGDRTAIWRYRVQIDPRRGAAKDMALQIIESPYAPFEEVALTGIVEFTATDAEAERLTRAIDVGLSWLTGVGAFTAVGFGRLLGVRVESPATATVRAPVVEAGHRFGIKLTFDRPLCIASPQSDENLFQSTAIIPGGVLKGALAHAGRISAGESGAGPAIFRGRKHLTSHFEHVTIAHAVPIVSTGASRPAAIPMSLVAVGSHLHDVALAPGPRLVLGQAPAFQPDWKPAQWALAAGLCGSHHPPRQLVVHNKHDTSRRRAEEGKLYAYELVKTDDHVWYAEVSLERIDGESLRDKVVDELLGVLRGGLRDVGKTRATAAIEILQNPLPAPNDMATRLNPQDLLDHSYGWVVVLQAPALMCDPQVLPCSPDPERALHEEYAAFWRGIDPHLTLTRFFARQSLTGGNYLWKRFGQRGGRPYYPYLITDAGSVFLLADSKGAAAERVKSVARDGLPTPGWAVNRYRRNGAGGDHWENNPYIPQNGYGQIAVNMPLHWTRHPEA